MGQPYVSVHRMINSTSANVVCISAGIRNISATYNYPQYSKLNEVATRSR